jgi:hypothetical protein
MKPTTELIDAIYRDRILHARAMPIEEKCIAGPRLFRRVCRIMTDGIRNQFPNATEEEVQTILRQRLALTRRLENGE